MRSSPIRRRQARETHDFDYDKIGREALELRRQQQLLADERDELRQREKALEPWGEFVLPPKADLAGHRLWFYRLPHRQMEALQESDLTWEAVGSDARFEYVVVIALEQPVEFPVTPIELDPRGLTAVRTRLEEIDSELEGVLWRRAELTRWCRLLERNLDAADDQAAHRHASAQTLDVDRLFALQAWIAEKDVPFLDDLVSRHGLAMTYQSPDPTEVPPTKLENTGPMRGGEAAVSFYITPEYRTWDPSVVMYFSFAVFFGMIMSDAGYGLILAVLLAAFWRRLGQTDERRRLRSLCAALAVASVAYGRDGGQLFWRQAKSGFDSGETSGTTARLDEPNGHDESLDHYWCGSLGFRQPDHCLAIRNIATLFGSARLVRNDPRRPYCRLRMADSLRSPRSSDSA